MYTLNPTTLHHVLFPIAISYWYVGMCENMIVSMIMEEFTNSHVLTKEFIPSKIDLQDSFELVTVQMYFELCFIFNVLLLWCDMKATPFPCLGLLPLADCMHMDSGNTGSTTTHLQHKHRTCVAVNVTEVWVNEAYLSLINCD